MATVRMTARIGGRSTVKGVAADEVTLVGVSNNEANEEHPNTLLVLAAYIFVAIGVIIGNLLATVWVKPDVIVPEKIEGIGLFAIFYIVAQTFERLMEPVAGLKISNFGSSRRVELAKSAQKVNEARILVEKDGEAKRDEAQTKMNESANDKAKANQIKNNTQVVVWALASFFAILLSGTMGLYLLEVVGVKGMPAWTNVMVTGLAIGAGTGPLHELIKLVENKREESEENNSES